MKTFGANHVVSSKDSAALRRLSTVNVKLDWDALIGTLARNGVFAERSVPPT
jgi:hypothetical protein